MGLSDLVLVSPKKFPHTEAVAMASGADDLLETATVCASLPEALQGCSLVIGLSARKRELSHELIPVREAAMRAVTLAHTSKVALVFGTEMSGLSNAELDQCQLLAMIHANPGYSSLNLAQAVQVVAYEARIAALGAEANEITVSEDAAKLSSHEEIEGYFQHLETTLIEIGFLDVKEPKRLMRRLRLLFTRARLQKEEVNIMRGILKEIQKVNFLKKYEN